LADSQIHGLDRGMHQKAIGAERYLKRSRSFEMVEIMPGRICKGRYLRGGGLEYIHGERVEREKRGVRKNSPEGSVCHWEGDGPGSIISFSRCRKRKARIEKGRTKKSTRLSLREGT